MSDATAAAVTLADPAGGDVGTTAPGVPAALPDPVADMADRLAPHHARASGGGGVDGGGLWAQLGNPRAVCSPMVDQSELAFRMLVRRYGVGLA